MGSCNLAKTRGARNFGTFVVCDEPFVVVLPQARGRADNLEDAKSSHSLWHAFLDRKEMTAIERIYAGALAHCQTLINRCMG